MARTKKTIRITTGGRVLSESKKQEQESDTESETEQEQPVHHEQGIQPELPEQETEFLEIDLPKPEKPGQPVQLELEPPEIVQPETVPLPKFTGIATSFFHIPEIRTSINPFKRKFTRILTTLIINIQPIINIQIAEPTIQCMMQNPLDIINNGRMPLFDFPIFIN